MQLTQKQESLIARYLRDVLDQVDDSLPGHIRERGMTRLESRIRRELAARPGDTLGEAEVREVLDRLGEPVHQAAAIHAMHSASGEIRLARENRVWLGVCTGIAEQLDVPPWAVRVLAFALGLATGPLALFTYLGVYLWLYLRGDSEEPPIRKGLVAWRSASALIIVVALNAGSNYALRLIYLIHEKYLQRPRPELGDWGWLESRTGEMCFYALIICVPMAMLSAMPVSEAWEYTLKRFSQALLALYAILLSFGLASVIVGLIMHFVHEFT